MFNSRGKSGGGAAALSGHQPDLEGLLVYPVDFGVGAAGGDGRGAVLYPAGPPVQGPPPSDGEGYVPRAAPGGHPAELPGGGRIRPGRGVGAAVRSLPVAEPLRGRAAGGGHGRHGLASAGAGGGCAQNSPFSPAFLGVYWGKGKTAMLDFRMDTFLAGVPPPETTRGRRRS